MKKKNSLTHLGKSPYSAPECLCCSFSTESSILAGSNFNVTSENFFLEDDDEWM